MKKLGSTTGQVRKDHSSWVHDVAAVIRKTPDTAESRMKTVLNCDIAAKKPALFVPADMAELQPRNLRYLHAFAKANNMTLIEDRRRVEIDRQSERRNRKTPMIAVGLSMLLKQTGMPGTARSLSSPHRLNPGNPHVGIAQLIQMAAYSTAKSKRIVILPNRMMVDVLDNDTQPIAGYACNLVSNEISTVLSHFDSTKFKAIGYSAGDQYIIHVCLAGGTIKAPALWTHLHTLSRTSFKFQLFPGSTAASDFGLMFATFYMDLANAPHPWWRSPVETEATEAKVTPVAQQKREKPALQRPK
jgi:hypothetical protein